MRTRRTAALAAGVGLMVMAGGAAAAEKSPDAPRLKPDADDVVQKAWAQRHLDREGWLTVGNGSLTFWFVPVETTLQNAYPIVRDWVRVEEAGPSGPGVLRLSTLIMMEADCAKNSARTLRTIAYSHNNLRGRITADLEDEAAKPTAMPPGSLGDLTVKAICRAAEAAAPSQSDDGARG
jgi:hypothetical protein